MAAALGTGLLSRSLMAGADDTPADKGAHAADGTGRPELEQRLADALRAVRSHEGAMSPSAAALASQLVAAIADVRQRDAQPAPAQQLRPRAVRVPAAVPVVVTGQPAQRSGSWGAPFPSLPEGSNAETCGYQPSQAALPSRKCPIPGLNNLLYSTHNRYYCAFRDRWKKLPLRDRSCHKHSTDFYRFSSVLTANASHAGAVPVCWADDHKDPPLQRCEWKHIPSWYGSPAWWKARSHIDFRPEYYRYARSWVHHAVGGRKYLSLHVRRGDYKTHCAKLRRKREPPWVSFTHDRSHRTLSKDMYGAGCYPSVQEIVAGVSRVLQDLGGEAAVVVSTNEPELVDDMRKSGHLSVPVVTFPSDPSELRQLRMRLLDAAIVDMALISQADAWILNRFSSFSGTAFEMSTLHGNMNRSRLWWW
eukprot:TRINITY_DN10006_c0_g1_i1.p1 TRINITY_DN10006_c0_g1~~TRINITY_DN10006_c0_g1_i1.p1  ORF type:complete len:481 (+),score=129.82 TRINITY_DN10006_c0_g1_i1:188-1444(+)